VPSLISFSSEIKYQEYFPKAHRGYQGKWDLYEEEEYPHICYAHTETSNKRLLKDIRLYIERLGKDDAFYIVNAHDYSYCYNLDTAKYSWDESWERVTNHWYKFYFSAEEDRTLLMLKHDDLKIERTEFRPDYYWHTSENTRSW
jgi:hypothetical protein